MNTQKIIKYILIAIPVLFLAKCGVESVVYNGDRAPKVNPNPKEKVRIYGKFPFEKDVNMQIAVIYINKNSKCDHKVWMSGSRFSKRRDTIFPATIKDGKFESIVNLDDYTPGVCDWRAHRIYIFLKNKSTQLNTIGDVSGGIYMASIKNNNVLNSDATTIMCSYKKETFWKGFSKETTKTILKCNSEDYLNYDIPYFQKEIHVDFVHKNKKEIK